MKQQGLPGAVECPEGVERPVDFRDIFASREPLRAFIIFGAILLGLMGIFYTLAYKNLRLEVLRENLDLSRQAARGIARDVAGLGQDGEIIDYGRLRAQRERMRRMVEEHVTRQRFIRHVEIRDRFGVRLLFVESGPASIPGAARTDPVDWETLRRRTIRVPLLTAGIRPEGEVLLGFTPQALDEEVLQRIEGLRVKTWIAGVMALGLLVLASFYVVHLIRKNRRLEQARQSAARASYVGLLASGLAHEIRNPLNAMNMNLQMLEEELQLADPEQAELLDSTKSEIKRLERLVNNFLSYARPARPRFEARDLNQVVGQVVRLLDADFRQSEVKLVVDSEPLLPKVEIDETQLKQALINLMVNARQVLCNGGTVRVRTRAGSHGDAVVEIEDDGPGIATEVQQRIFDVFYSSRGGGTGLGLPIAKQIVERHGGSIELHSVEGRGTTFRIRLPRRHAPAKAAAVHAERHA